MDLLERIEADLGDEAGSDTTIVCAADIRAAVAEIRRLRGIRALVEQAETMVNSDPRYTAGFGTGSPSIPALLLLRQALLAFDEKPLD